MGLFWNKKEGGIMDVIRCDEKEFLIWKWSPGGESSKKENAIRYGSSLRVKDGEVAVFIYKQNNGTMQDFIEGPFDETIKTANFPILTSIVGSAFGENSPFQAEIYFINLAGNIQVPFYIPDFMVYDHRFQNFGAPIQVKGKLLFNITNYKQFIKLNRMTSFNLDDFHNQVKTTINRYVKSTITQAPKEYNIPVLQIEQKLDELNTLIEDKLKTLFYDDFGINLKRADISSIQVNRENDEYKRLQQVAGKQEEKMIDTQTNINLENLEETLRINREEHQRAQKLQTETNYIGTHALNQQTEVLKTAATSLGEMGNMGTGENIGMNPANMMVGMMMGGAIGGQMANMMNTMGQGMNQNIQQQMQTPPPPPVMQYWVIVEGQQNGPFNPEQLLQLYQASRITRKTYVWKQGMSNWEPLENVQELNNLFKPGENVPPPPLPGIL